MTAIPINAAREFDGTSPNGNPFNSNWVARTADGAYLDHDQYRHDLITRLERRGYKATLIKGHDVLRPGRIAMLTKPLPTYNGDDLQRQRPALRPRSQGRKVKYQNRDSRDGRFTFDSRMDRLCACGHVLGDHYAAAPHECCIDGDPSHPLYPTGCQCSKFRLSRKKNEEEP